MHSIFSTVHQQYYWQFILSRQTVVLVFYFLALVMMMLVRPLLNVYVLKSAKPALYSALYFLPVLSVIHCLFCGLICKSTD